MLVLVVVVIEIVVIEYHHVVMVEGVVDVDEHLIDYHHEMTVLIDVLGYYSFLSLLQQMLQLLNVYG